MATMSGRGIRIVAAGTIAAGVILWSVALMITATREVPAQPQQGSWAIDAEPATEV